MLRGVESKLQRSSSSPIKVGDDDDAGGPPPVFVLLESLIIRHFSILKLKLNKNGHPEEEELVRFEATEEDPEVNWIFSSLTSSTGDLYVLPMWLTDKPNHAYKFNFEARDLQPINPPRTPKCCVKAVNLGDHIFFMEQPEKKLYAYTDLECYHPGTDSWKLLKPFPQPPKHSRILATAVCGDTILFSVVTLHPIAGFEWKVDSNNMWAYDVHQNEWYPVGVKDDRCFSIEGEAVVIQNTMYALTSLDSDLVLALSIQKEETGRGPKFTCSLRSHIQMEGMTPDFFKAKGYMRTRQLVHLGNDDFCLVHSCQPAGEIQYQPIHLTYIKREGKHSMYIMRGYEFKIKPGEFEVLQAFSLPKGMASALEKGSGPALQLDSFSKAFLPTQKDNTDSDTEPGVVKPVQEDEVVKPFQEDEVVTVPREDNTNSDAEREVVKPVQEDEIMTLLVEEERYMDIYYASVPLLEEGHSIHVKNLPSNVNNAQLEKALKEFGPIKRGGIRLWKNKKRNSWYANVEFESATSKQHAIKALTFKIGGCEAKISEITPADCYMPSSSFGKNKFKMHAMLYCK